MLSISKACLLLVLGGTAQQFAEAQAQKARVHDPAIYDSLYHWGEFAAASIPDTCKVPPYGSKVLRYLNNATTDTQATVFRDDAAKQIILSLRGSSSLMDFITDFEFIPVPYTPGSNVSCPGCQVHSGFYNAWISIMPQAEAALDAALTKRPTYDVIIVGHSLGGALAKLAFVSLKPMTKYNIPSAWSFGEPRVGNPAFADFTDKVSGAGPRKVGIYHRTTHANDGVPQLPSQMDGFRHSRTEFWEQNAKDGNPSAKTTFRCFGQEPFDCNDAQGGVFINEAHVTYAGINYATVCTKKQGPPS